MEKDEIRKCHMLVEYCTEIISGDVIPQDLGCHFQSYRNRIYHRRIQNHIAMKFILLHIIVTAAITVYVNKEKANVKALVDRVPFRSLFKKLLPLVLEELIRVPMVEGKTIGEHLSEQIMSRESRGDGGGSSGRGVQTIRQAKTRKESTGLRMGANGKSATTNVVSKTATELNDKQIATEINEVIPSVIVRSKTSWIKEFLLFKSGTIEKVDYPRSYELSSSIKTYQDVQSDLAKLDKWTEYVVADAVSPGVSTEKFNDVNYKKYGRLQNVDLGAKLVIDCEELRAYLINVHEFKLDDLKFLNQQGLDHGTEEIDRELNAIKEREGIENREIDIGGDSPSYIPVESGTGRVLLDLWCLFILFVVVC